MSLNKTKAILFLASLLFAFGLANNAKAANFPLEITNIEKVGQNNRVRFAYPSIEYSFYVAVRGGIYPYKYELTHAPSGMNIDENTGKIKWNNPTEVGSPHSCKVKITDGEGSNISEAWTINVTTSTGKFRFVDAVNGTPAAQGGTGTINNPWKNVNDFYLDRNNNSYQGAIIYFRAGTYHLWDAPGTQYDARGIGGNRIFFHSNHPVGYLAYPGEEVIFDQKSERHMFLWDVGNLFFQGIKFVNNWNFTFEILGGAYFTVIDSIFDGLSCHSTYANQSHLAYFDPEAASNYHVFIGNTFDGTGSGGQWATAIKAYATYYTVFERNEIYNYNSDSVSLKNRATHWALRGNKIYNNYEGIRIGYLNLSYDNEISYNYIYGCTRSIWVQGSLSMTNSTPNYFFRNTIVDSVNCPWWRYLTPGNGIFKITNNIFINSTKDSGSFGQDFYRNKQRFLYLESGSEQLVYENRFVFIDNFNGIENDNIIDSNGLLASAHSSYLGTHGWQFSDGSTPMDKTTSLPFDPIPGDINKDGVVNIFDYNIFLQHFRSGGGLSKQRGS
jgi:hypothetical protein